MVSQESDYDFVTFTHTKANDYVIDANILPARDVANDGSARFLKATDPAFINEAIGEFEAVASLGTSTPIDPLNPTLMKMKREIDASYFRGLPPYHSPQYFYAGINYDVYEEGKTYRIPSRPMFLVRDMLNPMPLPASSSADFHWGGAMSGDDVRKAFYDIKQYKFFYFYGNPTTYYYDMGEFAGWTRAITSNYDFQLKDFPDPPAIPTYEDTAYMEESDIPTTPPPSTKAVNTVFYFRGVKGRRSKVVGYEGDEETDYNPIFEDVDIGYTYSLTASSIKDKGGNVTSIDNAYAVFHATRLGDYVSHGFIDEDAPFMVFVAFLCENNVDDVATPLHYVVKEFVGVLKGDDVKIPYSDIMSFVMSLEEVTSAPSSYEGMTHEKEVISVSMYGVYIVLRRGPHTDFSHLNWNWTP